MRKDKSWLDDCNDVLELSLETHFTCGVTCSPGKSLSFSFWFLLSECIIMYNLTTLIQNQIRESSVAIIESFL